MTVAEITKQRATSAANRPIGFRCWINAVAAISVASMHAVTRGRNWNLFAAIYDKRGHGSEDKLREDEPEPVHARLEHRIGDAHQGVTGGCPEQWKDEPTPSQ